MVLLKTVKTKDESNFSNLVNLKPAPMRIKAKGIATAESLLIVLVKTSGIFRLTALKAKANKAANKMGLVNNCFSNSLNENFCLEEEEYKAKAVAGKIALKNTVKVVAKATIPIFSGANMEAVRGRPNNKALTLTIPCSITPLLLLSFSTSLIMK